MTKCFATVLYGERELMIYRNQETGRYFLATKRLLPSRMFPSLQAAQKSIKSAVFRDLLNAASLASADVEVNIREPDGTILWRKLYTDKPLKALVYEIESAE